MNQDNDDPSAREQSFSTPFYGQDPHEIDFLEGISQSSEHDREPEESRSEIDFVDRCK